MRSNIFDQKLSINDISKLSDTFPLSPTSSRVSSKGVAGSRGNLRTATGLLMRHRRAPLSRNRRKKNRGLYKSIGS